MKTDWRRVWSGFERWVREETVGVVEWLTQKRRIQVFVKKHTKEHATINWRRTWREFDRWIDERPGIGRFPWATQKRKIQGLVKKYTEEALFGCPECGKGSVKSKVFSNYKTTIKGESVVVPKAAIGVCDQCGAKSFSAKEYKRWEQKVTDE